MKEITITDKQKYLQKKYPFTDIPKLTDKKYCIHCEKEILVGDFKVFKDAGGYEYISCPNAPECDGTPADWFRPDSECRG